ncbi:hypothetical protein [Saccharibacillus kuerlensis]|uniref:Chloramphenicol acetyltransferase n=1 Tax=Saccharibacillus kuerlensis TaxID=459527 RepID=A0ABQ2KRU6_9BACL|nr:hypothetical protein [Saccharibacillus kuerlensis]GGN91435.1 hypothetical protein GCM10010969_03110 [Saccharibacillus kuerlensis]
MTIISMEGASAAGKTTTSAAFALRNDAFHILEVDSLWEKPEQEYPEWFFERQLDRWRLAVEKEQEQQVIVDIDLFQPFWYNWAFDFTLFNGQTLAFVEEFYRPLISEQKLGFPDKYFILYAPENRLRERKAGDSTRLRRGFELNLTFIEPQKRYFQELNEYCPGLVTFIESVSIEENVRRIESELPNVRSGHRYSMELFDFMVNWLKNNRAAELL